MQYKSPGVQFDTWSPSLAGAQDDCIMPHELAHASGCVGVHCHSVGLGHLPMELSLAEAVTEPGCSKFDHLFPEPREAGQASWSLGVATCNSTTWNSAKVFIQHLNEDMHVVLLQEHHLLEGEPIARAEDWLKGQGWQGLFEPAMPGKGTGSTGGVAVLARSGMGLRNPVEDMKCNGSRAKAAMVDLPGKRSVLCISLYLHDGRGLDAFNLGLLRGVGQFARGSGWPYIIGGDYQMQPEVLLDAAYPQQTEGILIAPDKPTCRTSAGYRCLDYFLVERG